MQTMEAAAKSQGWTAETYPDDIRAGFLAELSRQSAGTNSVNYAEIYSKRVTEGSAYLIVSRIEHLFGSKLPTLHFCRLSVFDFQGNAPKEAMSIALGGEPTEPWTDEHGNEVLNWYMSKNFPARRFQMSRVVSKTPLAGPADVSGLAIAAEVSGER